MKKVLALVLAVMMMSTFAFAYVANKTYRPGDSFKVATFTDADDNEAADIKAEKYTVSKINWTEGRTLVDSVKIKDGHVLVALKESYTMEKAADLKGTISIKMKDGARTVFTSAALELKVNNNVDKDSIVLTDKDETPVGPILDDTLYVVKAETYGFGTISFGGDDFEVVGRVYDKEKLFLENNGEFDKDVLLANEDVDTDIYFLNFPAKPSFKALQTISLFVEEGTKVYENKDGKLTEIKGKYDKETGAFVFTTRTLGDYVWAEKALKSVAGSTTAPSEGNPDTGANDVVGIATALAAVALVSAAAISLKK